MLTLNSKQIKEVEGIIGYRFNNKNYLHRALTHPSVHLKKQQSYQRLEFLGDSILNFIVALKLFLENKNFDEGQLTKSRAKIVSKKPLATMVKLLGLDGYILTDPNNPPTISEKNKSDIFESILAAIFLDSDGDLYEAEKFVDLGLSTQKGLFDKLMQIDPKSQLLEWCAKNKIKHQFSYEELDSDSRNNFKCKVEVFKNNGHEKISANGNGRSKKSAAQNASEKLLKKIFKDYDVNQNKHFKS